MLTAPPFRASRMTRTASGPAGSADTERANRPGRFSISCFARSSSLAWVNSTACVTPHPCIWVKQASASRRRWRCVSTTGPPHTGSVWDHKCGAAAANIVDLTKVLRCMVSRFSQLPEAGYLLRAEWRGRQIFRIIEAAFRVTGPTIAHMHRRGHGRARDHHGGTLDASLRRRKFPVGASDFEALQFLAFGFEPALGMLEPDTQAFAFRGRLPV